jgi:hypothetical protein
MTEPKLPPSSTLFLGVLGAVVVAALGFAGQTALRVESIDVRVKTLETSSATSATAKDVARLEVKVDRLEAKIDQVLAERAAPAGRK